VTSQTTGKAIAGGTPTFISAVGPEISYTGPESNL